MSNEHGQSPPILAITDRDQPWVPPPGTITLGMQVFLDALDAWDAARGYVPEDQRAYIDRLFG